MEYGSPVMSARSMGTAPRTALVRCFVGRYLHGGESEESGAVEAGQRSCL